MRCLPSILPRQFLRPLLAAALLSAFPVGGLAQPSVPIKPGQPPKQPFPPIIVQPVPVPPPAQPDPPGKDEPAPRMVLGPPLTLPVGEMIFSPAGDKLYTLIGQTPYAWDLATGKHETILKDLVGGHLTFAFGPGAKLVAIQALDRTVQVVDWETGKVRITLDGKIPITKNYPHSEPRLALSADGDIVVALGNENEVMHWDGKTGKLLKSWSSYPPFTGKSLRHWDLALRPDGKQIAVAVHNYSTGEVKLATREGKYMPGMSDLKSPIWKIAYSPDSKFLAIGLGNGSVQLWDVDPPKQHRTFTGHKDKVTALAFSPDGKQLFSGDEKGTIHSWKTEDGTKDQTWETDEGRIGPLAVSADGKRLAWAANHGQLRVINLADGKDVLLALGHTTGALDVVCSPDGKHLVSYGGVGTFRLWDAKTGKALAGFSLGKYLFSSMRFSPDSKMLVVEGKSDLYRWDVETRRWRQPLPVGDHMYRSVAISPDSKTVAVGGFKQTTLWDLASGEQLLNWPQPAGTQYLHFKPDGTEVFAILMTNQIQRLDIVNKKALEPIAMVNPINIKLSMLGAFSPDGTRVALGTGFHPVGVWDVATGRDVSQGKGIGSLGNIAFSPDGKLMAAADQSRVLVWEVATGKQRALFHKDAVGVMRVSFVGNNMIAGASEKNRILIWDL